MLRSKKKKKTKKKKMKKKERQREEKNGGMERFFWQFMFGNTVKGIPRLGWSLIKGSLVFSIHVGY